jgi:hypothetical protein
MTKRADISLACCLQMPRHGDTLYQTLLRNGTGRQRLDGLLRVARKVVVNERIDFLGSNQREDLRGSLLSRLIGGAAAISGLASGSDASTKRNRSLVGFNVSNAIVLYFPTPQVFGTGKQRLARELPKNR